MKHILKTKEEEFKTIERKNNYNIIHTMNIF